MAAEIPGYEELQEAVVAAAAEVDAEHVLELGTGTGDTALRVRAMHPNAGWIGIDSSEAMLARARERLPGADLRLQRLEDELPSGPFDLVVSALAVHHLDGAGKRELFSAWPACCGPVATSFSATSSFLWPGKRGRSRSTGWWICPTASRTSSPGSTRQASRRRLPVFELTSPCSALGSAAGDAPRAVSRADLRRQRLRAA